MLSLPVYIVWLSDAAASYPLPIERELPVRAGHPKSSTIAVLR
jgi:hypothetical protein